MQVVLIHGLGRSPLSLLGVAKRLQAVGYITSNFGYAAVAESYEQIVKRFSEHLNNVAQRGSYCIVAHSLGGVITRSALSYVNALPNHIVMLGTPNQSPRMAAIAWNLLLFRWFSGQCGVNLNSADFYKNLPPIPSPYTIIAGTGGPTGVWSPFGTEINDGIVALAETRITPQDTILEFPVFHTFMMNDLEVQAAILKALGN